MIHGAACPNHWRNFGKGSVAEVVCECSEMTLRERVEILLERSSSDDVLDQAEARLESMGLFPELAEMLLGDRTLPAGTQPPVAQPPAADTRRVAAVPSARELAALSCLATGLQQDEGAVALRIGKDAFRSRLKSAKSKLGAKTTVEAVAIAIRGGLLDLA